MTWATLIPALFYHPYVIIKGTVLFVAQLLILPSILAKFVPVMLSKTYQLVLSYALLIYHMASEIGSYFFPTQQQINTFLAETNPPPPDAQNPPPAAQNDEEYTRLIFVLIGTLMDYPRRICTALSYDLNCNEAATIIIECRFKTLFLLLAITGAFLVGHFPSVALYGIFGILHHALMIAGIAPHLLIIGEMGVTFGVIYASRTLVVGFALLCAYIVKSSVQYIRSCFQQIVAGENAEAPFERQVNSPAESVDTEQRSIDSPRQGHELSGEAKSKPTSPVNTSTSGIHRTSQINLSLENLSHQTLTKIAPHREKSTQFGYENADDYSIKEKESPARRSENVYDLYSNRSKIRRSHSFGEYGQGIRKQQYLRP
jgi:hypothetical protein